MIRNTKAQLLAVLATGALLGYLASAGPSHPQLAEAAPPDRQQEASPPQKLPSQTQSELLAQATKAADAQEKATGKKP